MPAALNARASKLVAALRDIGSALPRTNGIGFYVSVAFGLVQIDAVNARVDEHVTALRRIASTLPGVIGIGFYVFDACDLVQLTVSTDREVQVLGLALGLGAPEIRVGDGFGKGRWWFHATSMQEHGDVWIDLAGPHHRGRHQNMGTQESRHR